MGARFGSRRFECLPLASTTTTTPRCEVRAALVAIPDVSTCDHDHQRYHCECKLNNRRHTGRQRHEVRSGERGAMRAPLEAVSALCRSSGSDASTIAVIVPMMSIRAALTSAAGIISRGSLRSQNEVLAMACKQALLTSWQYSRSNCCIAVHPSCPHLPGRMVIRGW